MKLKVQKTRINHQIESATTQSQETITLKNEIARLCTVVQEQSRLFQTQNGGPVSRNSMSHECYKHVTKTMKLEHCSINVTSMLH